MKTLLKYGAIGVINTILGYGIILLLVFLKFEAEISNFLGYFFGFFLSYFLNKKYNFKSNDSHKKELPKFVFFMGIAYILNLFTLIMFYRFFHINIYMSQIFSGLVYTLSGYLLSRFFVFRKL